MATGKIQHNVKTKEDTKRSHPHHSPLPFSFFGGEKQKVDDISSSPLPDGESQMSLYLKSIPSMFWVTTWVMLNIVLTLINKAVFYYGQFTFPVTLSAVHMLVSSFFTLIIVRWLKWFPRAKLDKDGDRTMFLFSILFCSNIVFGNFSLQYGSVSLVQVIRATIPGITMILSIIVLNKRYSNTMMLTIVPVCIGMMLTVKGQVKLNFLGLLFSLIGSFLSALKVVTCNKFLVGSWSLHPLDLLDRSTFFAFLELTFFVFYF